MTDRMSKNTDMRRAIEGVLEKYQYAKNTPETRSKIHQEISEMFPDAHFVVEPSDLDASKIVVLGVEREWLT